MNFDDVINARANAAVTVSFTKALPTTAINGIFSTWKSTGDPGAGTTPGTTFSTCTSSTTGAIWVPSPPSGVYYIDRFALRLNDVWAQRQALHDRLAHVGGYSGASTALQSFAVDLTGVSAERIGAADYSDVSWFLEWFGATGGTPTTATVTYTNGAGTSGRTTTVAIGASYGIGRLARITGSGGESIRSVQSVSLADNTGLAGNFGIVATRAIPPIGLAPATVVTSTANWTQLRLRCIGSNPCLFMVLFAHTTSGTYDGRINLFSSAA